MRAIDSSGVRKNLSKVLDSVVDDFEQVIVTRRGDKTGERAVVIMALTSHNRMIETAHVLGGGNRARIMKSIAELKAGRARKRELIDVGDDVDA